MISGRDLGEYTRIDIDVVARGVLLVAVTTVTVVVAGRLSRHIGASWSSQAVESRRIILRLTVRAQYSGGAC